MPGLPPRHELGRLTELLTPAGCLVLVYEVPGGATDRLVDPLAVSLGGAGYDWVISSLRGCLVVIASPPAP